LISKAAGGGGGGGGGIRKEKEKEKEGEVPLKPQRLLGEEVQRRLLLRISKKVLELEKIPRERDGFGGERIGDYR